MGRKKDARAIANASYEALCASYPYRENPSVKEARLRIVLEFARVMTHRQFAKWMTRVWEIADFSPLMMYTVTSRDVPDTMLRNSLTYLWRIDRKVALRVATLHPKRTRMMQWIRWMASRRE